MKARSARVRGDGGAVITRRAAATPPSAAPPDPRERLREFAEFVVTQDPVALASLVSEPYGTLMRCTQIESFLRKYKRVLKARVTR